MSAPAGRSTVVAAVSSLVTVIAGMLALAILFNASGWSWLLVTGIGFVAGAIAGQARLARLAVVAVPRPTRSRVSPSSAAAA